MALRFRKSIKLAPGMRMNLSGSGASLTMGPRGASVGIGRRGTFLNTGIPGTGLYARNQLGADSGNSGGRSTSPAEDLKTATVSLSVVIEDDGTISFKDESGNAVSEYLIDEAKKQKGDAIRELIQQSCDKVNGQVEAVAELHLHTPNPKHKIAFEPQPFTTTKPSRPPTVQLGFFAKLFRSRIEKTAAINARAESAYDQNLTRWEAAKSAHDAANASRQKLMLEAQSGNPDAMEAFFGDVLQDINWPRETSVSFEVLDHGTRLAFDVDLPEVEDMPNKTATVPQRGYKLSVKTLSPTQVQKLYAKHVHSIGFRILGEAFAMLPTVHEVVLSGYSQRADKATGQVQDEYLFSVRTGRTDWERINFDKLAALDVLESLGQFVLQRSMSKSGVFKPVGIPLR